MWWLIGYGIAFGNQSNFFLGAEFFAGTNIRDYANFLFQWAFAGTSATIVSGCIAERMTIHSYLIFSAILVSFIYPIIVHWTWAEGWLYNLGYRDFAGGGIVHITGGSAGLFATIILGARIDRFSPTK